MTPTPSTQRPGETVIHDGRRQDAQDDWDGLLESCGENEGEELSLVANFSKGDNSDRDEERFHESSQAAYRRLTSTRHRPNSEGW